MLYATYKDSLNDVIFVDAVKRTAKKRGSLVELDDWQTILNEISEELTIRNLWKAYCEEYAYAKEITFEDILKTLHDIGKNFLEEK